MTLKTDKHGAPDECSKRGHDLDWYVDCWNCGGEGMSDHDCGEDTCCCLYPADNVSCDICYGKGGYCVCPICTEID